MHTLRSNWILFWAILLASIQACGQGGSDERPTVRILSHFESVSIASDETLRIESRSRDDGYVSQVEMRVDGLPAALYEVPEGEKSFRVEQSWQPTAEGTYNVSVIAYDDAGQASEPASVTVTVQSEVAPQTTALPAPTPAPTTATQSIPPTPTGDVSPTATAGDCTYDASFTADVTIPDNTQLPPGTEFVKTWRLRNSGTCDWGAGFQLAFVEGEQMGAPASVDVPQTPVGAEVEVSVPFQAPQEAGQHRSTWRMRSPGGETFGDRPYVQIIVAAAGAAAP